ncbi:alpha/beta hydrolase family protein [Parerythrobacter aestuarii]|uniref:alpha/beta hydrolase family protein n=1 Tax=Parerythrobacter aestuarii TaxID=3020909 RepID=UPI0024DE3C2A|nr:S9 family peptidase [Parerythrobacter aestuarii]
MRRLVRAVRWPASLLVAGLTVQLSAETLQESAEKFGARSSVLDVSLSPSGNKVAWIAPGPTNEEVLHVVDLAGDGAMRTILNNTGPDVDLTQCDWATETRLVCEIEGILVRTDGVLLGLSRLFAVDDDGSNVEVLSERTSSRAFGTVQDGGTIVALDLPGEEDGILMTRQYVEEATTGSRFGSDKSGLGLDRVDISNGRKRAVEQPDDRNVRYVADQFGNVRIRVWRLIDSYDGYQTGDIVYFYRDIGEKTWTRLGDVTIDGNPGARFTPVAVDADRNLAYGFTTINGFDAIAELPLDGSGQGKVLMKRGDVDVDRLIRIGRQRRVVGASYATEKRAIQYFDPALAELARQLGEVLPGKPLVDIVSASADENILLLVASSDTDPGMVYLYDRTALTLEPLLPMRDALVDQSLGAMQPVSFPAADGTMIPGYLTLPPGSEGKNLPAVVLPHGGPGARDEWGFDWLVQFFAARGYAVLQPNFRGSAGYGEDWFGRNGFQAWETAVGDVNDAGRWLVSQGIADPSKLAIAGWSYGGYAALQSQVLDPSLYKAVVAIAPVTDLDYLREEARAYRNFELVDEFIGRGDHVAAGSPARHAKGFSAPVLLVHGTLDQNVEVRQSRLMKDRLEDAGKRVDYVEFKDLEHSLKDSKARARMLKRIGEFLERSLES